MAWMRGNINQVMGACKRDILVAMDFFNSTIVENEKKADYFGLDQVNVALDIAGKLMESKYDTHIVCGLKTVSGIYKCYSDVS